MKKFYILAAIALTFTGSAVAQSFEDFTTEQDLLHFGGLQALAMSPSGRYIGGSTFSQHGFIYDCDSETIFVPTEAIGVELGDSGCQILAVDNNGYGYGFDANGAIKIGIDGSYTIMRGGGLPHACTPDGSLLVGFTFTSAWQTYACYWENGEMKMLETPTTEDMGFRVNGSRAIDVSDDGSVILGYLQDRLSTYPMVVWIRQADGTYKVDPICYGLVEMNITYKYDADGFIISVTTGPNPYIDFQPAAMTSDGKYIAMYVSYNDTSDPHFPMQIGIFNLETRDLEVYDTNQPVFAPYGHTFIITDISDDLTIIGSAGAMADGPVPFIFSPKTGNAQNILKVFPTLSSYLEPLVRESIMGNPMFISKITPNGDYICGYNTILYDADNDGAPDYAAGRSFRITTDFAGVENVYRDEIKDQSVYNLNGMKVGTSLEGLSRGIYIQGGKKIVVK